MIFLFLLNLQIEGFHLYKKHHSIVKDACKLEELNVKNLPLRHTDAPNILQRKEPHYNEGKKYFNGNRELQDKWRDVK